MELLSSGIPRRAGSALLFVGLTAILAVTAAAGPRGEYAVKAEFLVNFASLVEWPEDSLRGGSDLRVGILGEEAVVDEIRSRIDGRTARSHVVRAERLGPLEKIEGIHMVYVTASASSKVEEIREALAGASVLLVGESAGFAERGGAINFYDEKSRIRFEVNPGAVRSAGLKVSSRLLAVAKVVQ